MSAGPHPLLTGFPVAITLPVQWGEMDAYGHVNNTVLFRYFETARVEFLERCGFLRSYDERKIGAILHSTSCRFRHALFYPDTVQVGGRAIRLDKDRFTMEYRVVSFKENAVAADGEGVIVSFDYARRSKTSIPRDVVRGILALSPEIAEAPR